MEQTVTTEPMPHVEKELNIGVCISGGGYRATSFGLGTLSYLNQLQYNKKPLLQHVRALSTVSGGSITGITYAQWAKARKPFSAYFNWLKHKLNSTDIVAESVENYANDNEKNSIIEGFASSYAKHFLNNFSSNDDSGKYHKLMKSIQPEYDITTKSIDSHILYYSINATDFNTGTPFRFISQLEGSLDKRKDAVKWLNIDRIKECKKAYYIGNGFYKFKDAGELPLHVMMAASSCFPGGFEPIMLRTNKFIDNEKSEKVEEQLALMDGGIVDNQGIDAMLRYHEDYNLDLAIIVDAASPKMDKYTEAKSPKIKYIGDVSLQTLINYVTIANCIALICLIAALPFSTILTMIFTILVTLLTPISLGLVAGKKYINKVLKEADFSEGTLRPINKLKINAIVQILINRFTSLKLLVTTVFMKHLRRLNADRVYVNKTKMRMGKNVFFNTLYQLKPLTKEERDLKMGTIEVKITINDNGEGLKRLNKIAQHAFDFGTTLWVPKKDDHNCVKEAIVTGQFTTCANILNTYKPDHPLYQQAVEHWKAFLENPYWLYDLLDNDQK